VDETTDPMAGKLDTEVPSNPHLICSKVLHHTNHSTVARFVYDGLKVLWPIGVKEKLLILYADAATHMLKAATVLKVFYPNLIHFTCLAHGLQRVAEEVRAKLPQVNKLILMTKKVFLKAPHRVQSYMQCLPDASLPREPVPTRWGTWIEAVNFYSEHSETAKSIVAKFPSESAVLLCESQSTFSDPEVACSISYILRHFDWLPECINV
jgi:hypothetical protein